MCRPAYGRLQFGWWRTIAFDTIRANSGISTMFMSKCPKSFGTSFGCGRFDNRFLMSMFLNMWK